MEEQLSERVAERDVEFANAAGVKKQNAADQAVRSRQRQELELQRERVLDARTSNPHRRAALESALADIEARLANL